VLWMVLSRAQDETKKVTRGLKCRKPCGCETVVDMEDFPTERVKALRRLIAADRKS